MGTEMLQFLYFGQFALGLLGIVAVAMCMIFLVIFPKMAPICAVCSAVFFIGMTLLSAIAGNSLMMRLGLAMSVTAVLLYNTIANINDER
ncbi:hypothetical protein KA078_00385 [Candidatus Woesebacteria bacterium]|nr:hypothetical protein [Candidatus Woesebacteria bacterium]